ncbi:MAG: type IX secretion system sortase PorU [Saprospiraceae bacterium]|nr:type IX secretion system sortase PorU [Saprospiraceae bacterium]
MKFLGFNFLFFLFASSSLFAQKSILIHKDLSWEKNTVDFESPNGTILKAYKFTNAVYLNQSPQIPHVIENFNLPSNTTFSARLMNEKYELLENPISILENCSDQIKLTTKTNNSGTNNIGSVFFCPIRKISNNQYERLVAYDLSIIFENETTNIENRGPQNTFNSVLESGSVYKFYVNKNGLCKLDYNFLKNDLKIDIDKIDPRNIHLYGNGGFALPQSNNIARIDDLTENSILVKGEEDGKFDAGDFIIFNALGSDKWVPSANGFSMLKNIYDDKSYYYIKISGEKGNRIVENNNIENTDYVTNTYNIYDRYEKDETNLLARSKPSAQGGGKQWYGDYFFSTREKTFTNLFQFNKLVKQDTVFVSAAFAARSSSNSYFELLVNGNPLRTNTIYNVTLGDIENGYARKGFINNKLLLNDDNISVTIKYPNNGVTSEGWVDFIEVNGRAELAYQQNKSLYFRDLRYLDFATTSYKIANANSNLIVWDITDPYKPLAQKYNLVGTDLSFGSQSNSLKQYAAFSINDNFQSATAIGKIDPQNIHGTDNVDMAIIYYKSFEKQAKQLADFRKTNGLSVATILVDQIYNEFSSGATDPTAIRDFAKMLFDRNKNKFKYLLLFGDGSFDYKGLMNGSSNTSFIPVYETDESLAPIESYPTDDYYALLTNDEGYESSNGSLKGALDIAVGRLTVTTADEAQDVVDKIIRYESSPACLGDWRNRIMFVGDDEDGNLHTSQIDGIANKVSVKNKIFNQDKVFFDATQRLVSSGGARYPYATEQINRNIDNGVMTVNYLGHGGPTAWAQERVLTLNDVLSWTNSNKLPLFVTATCSFSGYDDPTRVSAGEEILLKSNGGAIALFSTVRPVYAHSNERLTLAVFDTIYGRQQNQPMRLGEILRVGKNMNSTDTIDSNARKFTLLGDPATRLALPRYNVVTTKIRGKQIDISNPDTLKAFQKVAVEGFIANDDGSILSSFNGSIVVTLYDKIVTTKTLGQGEHNSPYPYTIQKTILFKGNASVTNGAFKITIIVPKDIDYKYGLGKISYYASDNKIIDAAGFHLVNVGGTDNSIPIDNKGPVVNVFMNDDKFIFGGLTDQNPLLYVKLSDDNGINLSNASVGHDLVAILDNNTQNSYILNQYYESSKDDYTKGDLKYPLKNLSEGETYNYCEGLGYI